MNNFKQQQGSLVIISMFILAGVAAVGVSLVKMRVSGVDVASEYIGGNSAFSVAESGFQVGLKQFKDAECDPSSITGAAAEGADGSTKVAQSLGKMGGFELNFCPMDGTCFPDALIPSDTDVVQADDDDDDVKGTKHPYWQQKYGKHGKLMEWITGKKQFRYHHKKNDDKRGHWKQVRKHLKACHGPKNRNHHNNDPKCQMNGELGVEDSVSYWMVTAVDNASNNKRTLKQIISCDPGEKVVGNLFSGSNYAAWDPKSMIDQSSGTVVFGASSGSDKNKGNTDHCNDGKGNDGNKGNCVNNSQTLQADGDELILPDDADQDVWFRATFKQPVTSGANLALALNVKNDGYKKSGSGKQAIECGDSSNVTGGIDLTKSSTTIKCTRASTSWSIKCDGTEDPDCNISTGKLHINLGKFNTKKVKEIAMTGKSTELYNAFIGAKNEGNPANVKPKLEIGQWSEQL